MERRTAGRIAWALVALFVVLAGVALWLTIVTEGWGEAIDDLVYVPIFATFGVVGALITSAQPRNAVGWMFLGISVSVGAAFFADTYARYSLAVRPLPGAVWMAWLSSWLWIALFAPTLTFLPLLFPDGRLPSRRWRPFAWVTGAFLAFSLVSFALEPGPLEDFGVLNPIGVPALEGAAGFLDGVGILAIVGLALVSAVSLFLRYRRAMPERRQQIKWVAFAVGLMAAWFLFSSVMQLLGISNPLVDTVLPVVAFASLPVGAGIGILRYRLFDIDVVINRAVLFGLLAAFVTAVYVGIVVGIGAVVGSRGNLLLSILATAFIAVLFQPIRERARHLANRMVYGKRATPYELLSEFAERLAGGYSIDDVLPRMARLLGEGTGAIRARIWLRLGSELRAAAAWPADAAAPSSVPLAGDDLPPFPDERHAFPVRHRGELLGALTVLLRPGDSLTPTQEKLLRDLSTQAGLILRNVRLIEELRASRQRLVAAQDEERRRIERNIHDGAQQQLVALSVNLRLARTLAGKDSGKAEEVLDRLQNEAREALEDLRDLARGIYPPLLADQGLAPAVEAQARKSPVPVAVEADGVGRFPPEAEAAVYFCVLEALQNVAKYAEATRATVRLWEADGGPAFEVADDGRGFDPETTARGSGLQNMADRLEALGGSVDVASEPGRGTRVTGRIPVGEGVR